MEKLQVALEKARQKRPAQPLTGNVAPSPAAAASPVATATPAAVPSVPSSLLPSQSQYELDFLHILVGGSIVWYEYS